MRLSCNFVNVYTIAYRVQNMFTRVYTRASLTDILARKSARVGQVGEDRRACPVRGKLNGEVAGHADFRARILARKSARMSVSVSVPWNSSLMQLLSTAADAQYLFTIAKFLSNEIKGAWPFCFRRLR